MGAPALAGAGRGCDHGPFAVLMRNPVDGFLVYVAADLTLAGLFTLRRAGRLLRGLPAPILVSRGLGFPGDAYAALGAGVYRVTLAGTGVARVLPHLHPVVLVVLVGAVSVLSPGCPAVIVPAAAHRRQRRGRHARQQQHRQNQSQYSLRFHGFPSSDHKLSVLRPLMLHAVTSVPERFCERIHPFNVIIT